MKKHVIVRVLVAAVTAILVNVCINVAAWTSRDGLPVGIVSNKQIAPVYYDGFHSEPDNYWLIITDRNGTRHTAVVVNEDVWLAYEIGDMVTKWGVRK